MLSGPHVQHTHKGCVTQLLLVRYNMSLIKDSKAASLVLRPHMIVFLLKIYWILGATLFKTHCILAWHFPTVESSFLQSYISQRKNISLQRYFTYQTMGKIDTTKMWIPGNLLNTPRFISYIYGHPNIPNLNLCLCNMNDQLMSQALTISHVKL